MSFVVRFDVEFFTDDEDEAQAASLEIAEAIFDRDDVNIVAGGPVEDGEIEE